MMNIFDKKKKGCTLILDIGNKSIIAALVVFNKNNKPEFICSQKELFSIDTELSARKIELQMNKIVDSVVAKIVKEGSKRQVKIDTVFVVFSSPWFVAKTKKISLNNQKEFYITKDFLSDITDSEVSKFKEEMRQSTETVFELIESTFVLGRINGYAVNSPIGKKTKNFDAYIYLSLTHNSLLKKIQSIIHKHTHLNPEEITVSTFPVVSFKVVKDLLTDQSSFVLLDVTGELSEITLVSDDAIVKTVTIPSGKNLIYKQISKELNTSIEIAESTLKLYTAKKLNDDVNLKIEGVLSSVEKEWSVYLENALNEISPNAILPSSLFLTSDDDISNIYKYFLTIQKLDSTALFRKNLNITQIDLDKLSSFYFTKTYVPLDEFVIMDALYFKDLLIDK